jgi:hypothetical protein
MIDKLMVVSPRRSIVKQLVQGGIDPERVDTVVFR